MTISNYYELGPDADKVEKLVVMLHGVGSNGRDLISLAPMLAPDLPTTMFISPDAPFHCDMVPPGYPDAYQWFSLQSYEPAAMLAGVKDAFPSVESFIETLLERFNVSYENLVLLGFSQGTMTSLYTAPRLKKPIAGIMGFSGALLSEEGENVDDLQKMPIRLIHGKADDVVPVERWKDATETLKAQGYEIDGHTTPGLPHSIDQKGIDSAKEFLEKILA